MRQSVLACVVMLTSTLACRAAGEEIQLNILGSPEPGKLNGTGTWKADAVPGKDVVQIYRVTDGGDMLLGTAEIVIKMDGTKTFNFSFNVPAGDYKVKAKLNYLDGGQAKSIFSNTLGPIPVKAPPPGGD